MYRDCLTESAVNGWKPCKAAWATCGSRWVGGRGAVVVIVVENEDWVLGAEPGKMEVVLPDERVEAIRWILSLSFSDMY